MTRLEQLEAANPIRTDDKWGTSAEAQELFESIASQIDVDDVFSADPPRRRRPWVYAAAGFALTIAAALPLLLSVGNPPEGDVSDGTVFRSADSAEHILDDNFVTLEELEMAAEATVQCVIEAGGEARWEYNERNRDIDFTTTDPDSYGRCDTLHFRDVGFVWAAQDEPEPAEGFYFYASVVRCTEARTGNSYGELTQDSLGFMSTVGQRTVDKALADAGDVYSQCLDDVSSPPLHYYFVLECVREATGAEYPSLTDPGHGRLTTSQIEILDGAREEFPGEFNRCMGEVTID
jgi:hypothetical protein